MATSRAKATPQEHLIAGTAGGLISMVALYPLELIKTRMQVVESSGSAYSSFFGSLRTVVRQEGAAGFYRGMAPAILASSGSWGGYFFFYELSKKRKLGTSKSELGVVDHLLAGFEAGIVMVFMFNPLWLIKTRLALQGAETNVPEHRKYKGLSDALITIVKEEGVLGLYKGMTPALLLTSHGAIQFAVYEEMKRIAESYRHFFAQHGKRGNASSATSVSPSSPDTGQPAWVSMLIGGGSKIIASTATYPYQVIKSRLQQRTVPHHAVDPVLLASQPSLGLNDVPRYTGTWDCIKKIWKFEGIAGFFRGVVPSVVKVAPQAAITFLVYEECIKASHKFSGLSTTPRF